MTDWSHGYDVSSGYSFGFYREMAPDWLDLCAAAAGAEGSRDRGSGAFRYLDLGSGQGVGLCLLAAANPDAEFVGVDFLPEHIAHSQGLATASGLTNIRFIQADFLDLARSWPDDMGVFDYVALHGIYAWVSDAVRQSVVDCLGHATQSGSLVYVGYNSQPGWLAAMPFQHITRQLRDSTGEDGPDAIGSSIRLFERLLAGNALGFQALPGLKERLQRVKAEDMSYLVQEYLNAHWRPMWHSQVAAELGRAGLAFVATATVVENLLPDALPPALKSPIVEQENIALRQDLQDFVLNQGFRRDIFQRGPAKAAGAADPIAGIRLRLLSPPAPGSTIQIETGFGDVTLQPQAFAPIVEALAGGSKPFAELIALAQTPTHDVRRILLLMLDSPALAVEAACPGNSEAAQRLSAVLARGACQGAAYRHLAAAQIGSAIPATEAQLMLLDCWLESSGQSDAGALAVGLAARAEKLGVALQRDPAASARTFTETSLPRLRQLGAIA